MRLLVGTLAALGLALGLSLAPAHAAAPASPAVTATASPLPSPSLGLSQPATPVPAEPGEALPLGARNDVPILPYLLQLLVVTAVVAGIGYFGLRYMRDKLPGLAITPGHGKQLRVIEKLAVDPKRMVMLVNVGERYWLLGATESQITPIAELSKDDLGGQFARLLEQEKQRGETP